MCYVLSHSDVSDSLQTHGLSPTRLPCPWNFSGKILKWVAVSYSRSSRHVDRNCISCISLHWQVGSLPLCHLGRPHASIKNKIFQITRGLLFSNIVMMLFSHKHHCMVSFDDQFSPQMSKALAPSLFPFPETWEVLEKFEPVPAASGFFTSLR